MPQEAKYMLRSPAVVPSIMVPRHAATPLISTYGAKRLETPGLLPYFKTSEHWHNDKDEAARHGFSGPIHTSSGGRGHALREPLKEALLSTGLKLNPNMNSGDSNGVAQLVENWYEASRQHAAICYNLKDIYVMTNTVVQRVLLEGNNATGVELTEGQRLMASREVIVSYGALRTRQLLMLTGIGPKSEIFKFNIKQVAELPIGQHLHDHGSINIIWKLKSPDKGYAFGSPFFQQARVRHRQPNGLDSNGRRARRGSPQGPQRQWDHVPPWPTYRLRGHCHVRHHGSRARRDGAYGQQPRHHRRALPISDLPWHRHSSLGQGDRQRRY